MVRNADKIGPPSTSGDDPRITKIGKFLRKYKLDELPQLWNVLKRDMNIVGNRPTVASVIHTLTTEECGIILSRRPGITGLAALWDSNEEERLMGQKDPHGYFMENIYPKIKRLEIFYIKNRTIYLDLLIVLQTLLTVCRIPINTFPKHIRKELERE